MSYLLKSNTKCNLLLLVSMLFSLATTAADLPTETGQLHLGVASCANSLCHGAVIPHVESNITHTEYITWTRRDPHALTYNNLLRDDYLAITRKLGLKTPDQEPLCLACHASHVKKELRGPKFSLTDGIGCETCHGGAENYLSTHIADNATRAKNIQHGLYPTDNIIDRARLCLSCHYGTTEQFVTHEIMSAGHPRISFELDTFTELLPPHVTYDDDYYARKPVYSNVKMWALGQAMAAESMLTMLNDEQLLAAGLFPELSLFDCHSCHHPMSKSTWQQKQKPGLGPGVVLLNDSNLLMLSLILKQVDAKLGEKLSKLLKALHVASNSSPWTTKKRAAALTTLVQKAIKTIDQNQFSAQQTIALTNNLIATGIAGGYQDYIAAEQCVMGVGALIAAWNKIEAFDPETTNLIVESMAVLYDSVANDESFVPAEFESALSNLQKGLF